MLVTIERFLRRHRIAPTVFGRLAVGDPSLLRDLRQGRALRPPMEARLRGFMDGYALGRENADVG